MPGIVVFLRILRSFQEHLFLQSNSSGCFCQCVFIKKFLKTEVDCDFSFFFQGNHTVHQDHHQFLAVLSLRCSFQKTFQKGLRANSRLLIIQEFLLGTVSHDASSFANASFVTILTLGCHFLVQ